MLPTSNFSAARKAEIHIRAHGVLLALEGIIRMPPSRLSRSYTNFDQGQDNSAASFEKTLSTLSTKIAQATTRLDQQRQTSRRFKALWTLYSTFAYLFYSIVLALVLGWETWGVKEYAAIAGGPVLYDFNPVDSAPVTNIFSLVASTPCGLSDLVCLNTASPEPSAVSTTCRNSATRPSRSSRPPLNTTPLSSSSRSMEASHRSNLQLPRANPRSLSRSLRSNLM